MESVARVTDGTTRISGIPIRVAPGETKNANAGPLEEAELGHPRINALEEFTLGVNQLLRRPGRSRVTWPTGWKALMA